jgi:hypothetical protein
MFELWEFDGVQLNARARAPSTSRFSSNGNAAAERRGEARRAEGIPRIFIFSHDHPHPAHVHVGKGKRFSSWGLVALACTD